MATIRNKLHERTYFGLVEYLYPGLLPVIPLPRHLEMSLVPIYSCVFDNAYDGFFVHDSDVFECDYRKPLLIDLLFVVMVDCRKFVMVDTVAIFPRTETEVR